jgi:hypothetical protein
LLLDCAVDHPPEKFSPQRFRLIGLSVHHHGYVIAQTALELSHQPGGVGRSAPLGSLTDEELAAIVEKQY